jgi:hypothetical protein
MLTEEIIKNWIEVSKEIRNKVTDILKNDEFKNKDIKAVDITECEGSILVSFLYRRVEHLRIFYISEIKNQNFKKPCEDRYHRGAAECNTCINKSNFRERVENVKKRND